VVALHPDDITLAGDVTERLRVDPHQARAQPGAQVQMR
jgi:hypothetical protein